MKYIAKVRKVSYASNRVFTGNTPFFNGIGLRLLLMLF